MIFYYNHLINSLHTPMKKLLFLGFSLIVIVIIVAAATMLFLLKKEETFTLLTESGTVLYKKDGEEYTQVATMSIELPNKTYIKTEKAYAHVILPDKSMISLDQNTEIQIVLENNSTLIKQLIGKTWHRIQTVLSDEEYSVTTSTAIASVRGTKFYVDSSETDSTFVYSIEDTVAVAQVIPDHEIETLKYTNVDDGYIAEVPKDPDQEIPVFLGYIEIDKDIWYKRNLMIDKLFDTGNLDNILDMILNDDNIQTIGTEQKGSNQTQEDGSKVIYSMFDNINKGDYNTAALLLSEKMVGTDPVQSNSQLQAWAVTFSNWKKATILSVEKSDELSWTTTSQVYNVTFSITFIDQKDKGLWEEKNTRWFSVEKVGDNWMISDIATSI